MRDIMFYLEAQSKVGQSPLKDEIQGGDVVLPAEAAASGTTPKVNGAQRGGRRKKR